MSVAVYKDPGKMLLLAKTNFNDADRPVLEKTNIMVMFVKKDFETDAWEVFEYEPNLTVMYRKLGVCDGSVEGLWQFWCIEIRDRQTDTGI